MAETEDYDKSATPTAHKTSHQDGGSDELNVEGLSGELADEQSSAWEKVSGKPAAYTPEGHSASHEDGGSDEIDITGLVGTTPRAVLGDSTTGRVIRKARVRIEDGTDADTIAVELVARWNGDSLARIDNIAAGDDGTYIHLSANGRDLILKKTCFTGDIVSCLMSKVRRSSIGVAVTMRCTEYDLGITIALFNANTGVELNMTTIPAGKYCYTTLLYITTE